MWWDDSRVEATVTRQFVCSHLLPQDIHRLDQPLGFGDGLTDGTYWEWIDEKAKRIFLILLDLGMPDRVFNVVDKSWDDHDLPIPFDEVDRLALSPGKDDKLIRRFYYRQYHYLIKYIQEGDHIVYQDDDVAPVVVVNQGLNLNIHNTVDRVELPNNPGHVFSRRRFPIGSAPGLLSEEALLHEINAAKNIQNDHLISYFASYIHEGFGYVISKYPSEFNLKSLLTTTPSSIKSLAKQDRRRMVMNWIHCLADTLAYVHKRGRSHGNIRPSTILFSSGNHILYTDLSRLSAEALAHASDKSTFDKESYDYAAPEQWYRPSTAQSGPHRKNTLTSSSSNPTGYIIGRGATEGSSTPASALHAPNPHLNPQAADIFSLGCIILELLSMQMKRQTRSFASHRAAKHKTPGRGGAVLDSSFHKNIGQVESWMTGLAKDASKKDDPVFRGIGPMLQVVARMLAIPPHERPTALEVERQMYKILTESCQIGEPHCVHQYEDFAFGFSDLRLGGKQPEDFSIATKRQSSVSSRSDSSRRGQHARTSSGHEREMGAGGGGGLQALQNLRVTKVRTNWQTPVYAGTGTTSPC
ncbi:kinase-like domain-containing protein [Xylariaceae sp. FL0016]|nr:kinase-like domain-containing protein [Xylariaceae sp. FL0016]